MFLLDYLADKIKALFCLNSPPPPPPPPAPVKPVKKTKTASAAIKQPAVKKATKAAK